VIFTTSCYGAANIYGSGWGSASAATLNLKKEKRSAGVWWRMIEKEVGVCRYIPSTSTTTNFLEYMAEL